MDLGLTDKVAFIAGSSRGIGLAIAEGFLVEGARVVITGRHAESLQATQRNLEQRFGVARTLAISGDMTDASVLEAALEQTRQTFGGLHAVVANLGSGTSKAGFDIDRPHWEEVLNVNLLGSVLLAGAALRHLVAAGSGSLTFIASIAGHEVIKAPVAYSAAKAALLMAMKSYALQVGAKGVRVNAVSPGNVLFPGGGWEKKLAERAEFCHQYISDEVAMRRFGRPEEIADAVLYLASDRAGFITGAVLVVDGGQTRSIV
ncbi:MAG: SDR family oxidoreductase [Magnetococcales bacterium]|nr:SDR family oxidoreductase [Magnetococcales bacterium]